ncbi:MAG TPA: rhodanese-like domain-containing protein [Bdellovibrionales bacterium]|nr:sulfurtransferase [Pseudobdellovibrionaceae bacterium]HAG90712.1 rhodanese-like domain-containing protein [Bdellovibrionales bacterium]
MDPKVKDLSPNEVFEKKDLVQLVDVRGVEELQGELGHMENITHIPLDQVGSRLGDLNKDSTIVFICRSGRRSAAAASFAIDQGFDAYNMDGGMLLWNELNLPLANK